MIYFQSSTYPICSHIKHNPRIIAKQQPQKILFNSWPSGFISRLHISVQTWSITNPKQFTTHVRPLRCTRMGKRRAGWRPDPYNIIKWKSRHAKSTRSNSRPTQIRSTNKAQFRMIWRVMRWSTAFHKTTFLIWTGLIEHSSINTILR